MAVKVPRVVLRAEVEKHTKALMELDNVFIPFGSLTAHDQTGTLAVIVTEITMWVEKKGAVTL